MTFDDALHAVLKYEGGYVDDPADPGGATNMGITIGTLSDWLGRPATKDQVRALVYPDVRPIYEKRYWAACRCGEMPTGLALVVFDSGVNQGPGRAKRLLQQALGVTEDGILGPQTMAAVTAADEADLIDEMVARRAVHYASLQSTFHLGWFRRLIDVHRRALALI